jgi:O-antigen/teichoic acid export membrane protein
VTESSDSSGGPPAPKKAPIAGFLKSKLGRNFTGSVMWHALARLVQVVGMAYATRCLGPTAIGHSGTAMTVATCLQQVLGFGFEIALVRHLSKDRSSSLELLPAVFTFRMLMAFSGALIWLAVVWMWDIPPVVRQVWLWGAPNFAFLVLDYNWVFQAEERMPALTRIQLWLTATISLLSLLLFRPGQEPGSDLALWVMVNAAFGIVLWNDIQRRFKVRLWDPSKLSRAWVLLREGRPMWLYNVTYWIHHTLQLPLIYFLEGPDEGGLYRSAAQLVMPAQAVIVFFLLTAYPRMIEWRQRNPAQYVRRIWQMSVGWFLAGWVVFGLVWLFAGPVYQLIYGKAFAGAATIFPVLLLGKFVAAPNGMFLWALFADHRDWAGIKCVGPILLLETVVNLYWIPALSLPAVAWLSVASEALLIVLTGATFFWATRGLVRQTR